jgi:hypothetical protein
LLLFDSPGGEDEMTGGEDEMTGGEDEMAGGVLEETRKEVVGNEEEAHAAEDAPEEEDDEAVLMLADRGLSMRSSSARYWSSAVCAVRRYTATCA